MNILGTSVGTSCCSSKLDGRLVGARVVFSDGRKWGPHLSFDTCGSWTGAPEDPSAAVDLENSSCFDLLR